MPTAAERRRHYEQFTAHIAEICRTDSGARRTLREGRGRPVDELTEMHRFLTVSTRGHTGRHAHYTLASLIALVDPLEEVRAARRTPIPPAPRLAPESTTSPDPIPPAATAPVPDPTGGPITTTLQPAAAPPPADSVQPVSAADAAVLSEPAQPADPYSHAVWSRRRNLGAFCAQAVIRAGFHESNTDVMLRAFAGVSDTQLHRRLPHQIARLISAGIVPDWPVLLDDLIQRGFERHRVATRWLDSYYLTLGDAR